MWRQYLESLCHDASCFITLTYADENEPPGRNLCRRDTQLWLKRFRKALAPTKVRFFLCGEYGPKNMRPHYHVSLFGVGQEAGALVQETWAKGFTSCFEFNRVTAQYVAGYVVKKLADLRDPRMVGLVPEFSQSSNRPGIGALAVPILAAALAGPHGTRERTVTGDVPWSLQMGKTQIPLGRYLRQKLRTELGVTDEEVHQVKQRFFSEKSQEMCAVLLAALADEPTVSPSVAFVRSIQQKIWNAEGRSKIWKKRDTI